MRIVRFIPPGAHGAAMSEIYLNAIDSLRIGIEFFRKERDYSSRKHTILTLFHAIELFLKERLHRENRVLIYRDIDSRISNDSVTVGIKEILIRLDNIGLGLPKEQRSIIEKIQKRRNRIEHHRYDHTEEDELIIADSFKFILFFVEHVLKKELGSDLGAEASQAIQRRVLERNEREALAEWRLENWMKTNWPSWDPTLQDTPDEFDGTLECPICRETSLVIGYHEIPFCFHCNAPVDASECDECGSIFLVKQGCQAWHGE